MKKGAIFDMDGLMFDTEQIWQKCWTEIANETSVDLDPQFRKEICGTSGDLMKSIIEKYYHVNDGEEIMNEVKKRVHNYLANDVPEKPGIHEILKYFHDNGFKIAVASSSPREMIQRNLEKTNTAQFIDQVTSGTEVKNGKPAPDLFLHAAELININPQDCYVFEDAFNGVRAGKAAGCTTIMIPDTQEPNEEIKRIADGIFLSLIQAKQAIENNEI